MLNDVKSTKPAITVRPTGWTVLIVFLLVKMGLLVLSLLYLHPHYFALARATGHAVNVNLISFAVSGAVCIGGILMVGGGLR